MITKEKYTYFVFTTLLIVFFVIPEPVQKPLRIFIAASFFVSYFALLLSNKINLLSIVLVLIASLLLVLSYKAGSLQTSLINAYLCMFGLLIIKKNDFRLIAESPGKINKLYYILVIGIIVQFLVFRSADGRPKLSYEINLSGAYLFIFFLFSDIIKKKKGKLLVIILSFILLSRLLILSIILFYIIRYGKILLRRRISRINLYLTVVLIYFSFSIFTVWYTFNVHSDVRYNTGASRVTNINDGSNKLRFEIDAKVILAIIEKDKNLLWGYGDIRSNQTYIKKFFLMPHMELFDILVEFGGFILIFFGTFMLILFNKFATYQNLEIIIPVIFYTLFLWVRLFLMPSFESIFIIYLLYISEYKRQSNSMKLQS